MALTEIPIELSSTPSIIDNGNATAITIGSDESATFAGGVNVTGALTVDTDTLVADATNNRVGIGTGSPSRLAHLYNTSNPALRLDNGTNSVDIGIATSSGALLNGSSANDLVIARNGAYNIKFGTNGSTRATIDSAGRVGIGVSPQARLHVDGAEDYTGGIVLTAGAQLHSWFLSSDFVNVHNIHTSSASAAHTWQTNGTEKVRITPNGLTFNGDTAAANALSDYEQGTWSPSVSEGSAGASSAQYTKVGRMVTVCCVLSNFTNITSSSIVTIHGLPFNTMTSGIAVGSMLIRGCNRTGVLTITPYVGSNTGSVVFYMSFEDSNSYAPLQHNHFKSTSADILFSITYQSQ